MSSSWLTALNAERISRQDLRDFTAGLAVLVRTGLPLDHVLETLLGLLKKPRLHKLVQTQLEMVREGHTLSYAMSCNSSSFPNSYVSLVRAGEMSGSLGEVLSQLNAGLKRAGELTGSLASSLIYPSVLLLVSTLAVVFIMAVVLPSFASVFESMNMPLPPSAQVLVGIGQMFADYGWFLASAALVFLVLAAAAWRMPVTRTYIDAALLRLWPLGAILTLWQSAVYCRTLGLLFQGGVPLNEAGTYAASALANTAFRKPLESVTGDLKEGRSLAVALQGSPHLLPVVRRMVALGEESGELGEMLLETSDLLEERLKTVLKRATTLVEPLIILVMGGVVGVIVVTLLTTVLSLSHGGF